MSEVILKVEHISKQYRLGLVGTGTLSQDLKRWFYKIRGKDDPFLKIGDTNDRSKAAESDYVWAIKDISFEVKRGEVLGIIGKNGAGKSTLLKILSRVTSPTTGQIKTKGRIASLLEVGTGFHPELTGKENIYLNGAILGMTKAEIKAKEQEIVEFSGCQRYIDTPVKRYSSGMRVRLAFAVAAFLEPDILVVDEVLAVGDAEFQKKAIGKMQDISKGDGRTVLFVSHNMAAVKSLCTRALVLESGQTAFEGKTEEAVNFYLKSNRTNLSKALEIRKDRSGSGKLKLTSIQLFNKKGDAVDSVISGGFMRVKFNYEVLSKVDSELVFAVSIKDRNNNIKSLFVSDEMNIDVNILINRGFICLDIENVLLRGGEYNLTVLISEFNTDAVNHIDRIEMAFDLIVLQGDYYGVGKLNRMQPYSIIPATFS
ncbi:MAG: ABC transporter ATP-binding protein [Winogradskyella sp.]